MPRVCIASQVLIVLFAAGVRAQEIGSCVNASPEYAKALAEARKGQDCAIQCKGCGCKGGPGYRNPSTGHCVSYKALIAECGPAPHDRCQRECTPVVAGCARPSVGPPAKTQ